MTFRLVLIDTVNLNETLQFDWRSRVSLSNTPSAVALPEYLLVVAGVVPHVLGDQVVSSSPISKLKVIRAVAPDFMSTVSQRHVDQAHLEHAFTQAPQHALLACP